jgi:hypothetical protein
VNSHLASGLPLRELRSIPKQESHRFLSAARYKTKRASRAKIETAISLTESGRRRILASITPPKVGRMRANKQMERTTRKRVAGRCFSAATGACC